MSSFTFLILCFQACLIQIVYSQGCGFANSGYSTIPNLGLNSGLNLVQNQANQISTSANLGALNQASSASCGSYGGQGTGQVGVAGDIGVAGNTVVVGAVPVLGAVDFSGTVPASGSVSISGQCGCGCQA